MYGLKTTTSLFRPSSRPTSPTPVTRTDAPLAAERVARPLSKLSLASFRRPSPSPASVPTAPPSTVVQDGSFMEVLSLKLSEAVSKALAQPAGPAAPGESLAGRRPIPAGRGRALGILIVSEVKAAQENPHLYRAVIRTLQRPLSVLYTNLSTVLIPLLSSPAFHSPAAPTPQEPQLTPTQLHAVAVATFAGELLESFDEINLGVEDNLQKIREQLVSVVTRVVDPLMTGIKNELVPLLESLESTPAPAAPTNGATPRATGVSRSPLPHASIMTMQTLVPIFSRALSRIVASAYAEGALATLVISLVWRGMVALAHRPAPPPPPSPPASPSQAPATLKPKESKKALAPAAGAGSPPATPPASRFTLKLPPSRPASPPQPVGGPTPAADARALYDLLGQLPKPRAAGAGRTRFAREAVDEAFQGLSALTALLESVQAYSATASAASAAAVTAPVRSPRAAALSDLAGELDLLTEDVPIVLTLPVLLRALQPGGEAQGDVPALVGIASAEYRRSCLSGFGRAEECGIAVGERVLAVLRGEVKRAAAGASTGVEAGQEGEAASEAEVKAKSVLMAWLERELDAARAERDGAEACAMH